VEAALQQACQNHNEAEDVWERRLRRLDKEKHKAIPVEQLIANLHHRHWLERFLARHVLLHRGGRAVAPLQSYLKNSRSGNRNKPAIWVLRSIGNETTLWFACAAKTLLCPDCVVRCSPIEIPLPSEDSLDYYGCRACGQAEEFTVWPGEVVVVLDKNMTQAQAEQGNQLRVNWLQRRELFDFDWIEIVQASDEDVERFTVQAGNDTDEVRQPRYKNMKCVIGPACELSENTIRILEHTFGHTESTG
jgi:hypothetical protein